MKFTISREKFLEALQKIQNVVEKKNTVQILSYILLTSKKDSLIATATDLEVGISVSVPFEGSSDVQEGKVAISARSIVDIVKELPNKPITVQKKENNWVEVSCQKSTFNLVGLGADEFPPLPAFEDKKYINISASKICEMIDSTLFAASSDETRYHLNGVFLEAVNNNTVRMVSTDGHRLALIDKDMSIDGYEQINQGIIIPRKGIAELRRLLEGIETFAIALDRGNLLAKFENTALFIRLVDGDFPDYEQVIPKANRRKLVVDKEDLLGSLRRTSLLANEKSRGVRFQIKGNTLLITSSNPDLGDAKEELDIEFNNDTVDIGFNARYIIECLTVLKTKKITFEMNDKLSAGLLHPMDSETYRYVVMPMRI